MSLLDRINKKGSGNQPTKHYRPMLPDDAPLREKIFYEVLSEMDMVDPYPKPAHVEPVFQSVVEANHSQLSDEEKSQIWDYIYNELFEQGELTHLLADKSVDEVLVLGKEVFVTRDGQRQLAEITFRDNNGILRILDRIVAPQGIRIDEHHPIQTIRFVAHDRAFLVHATIGTLTIMKPTVQFETVKRARFTMNQCVENGTLSPEASDFLQACVTSGINLLVTGSHITGKTTLLNTLIPTLPTSAMIMHIARHEELFPSHPSPFEQWITWTDRRPNSEGKGAIPVHQLVSQAILLRSDYLLIEEMVGQEIVDLILECRATWWGTLYCPALYEVIPTLMEFAKTHSHNLPEAVIQRYLGHALDIVVHMHREQDGSIHVQLICEVVLEDDKPTLIPLFEYDGTEVVRTQHDMSESLQARLES